MFVWGCGGPLFFLRVGLVSLEERACRLEHCDVVDEGLSSEVFCLHIAAVNQLLVDLWCELEKELDPYTKS